MAATFDIRKSAVTLGLIFSICMLVWDLLVAVGGSGFVNWVMGEHFISTPLATAPFSLLTLIMGIIRAFIIGGIIGAGFAYVYEKV